ncbi:hypothetical protein DJ568_15500 [Mucilaginibacter hurinus]|uniref:Mor transcription activator domain-containing protein n=1 Tax=Mucilaginibacter hurinus TaxID=2201324 RepID=A0A367GML7_9SPHI|nr:hypothetical protein [Mucilaginibacter hurinus]RCH53943.1 hypothetical protein DJ568_15500 [Mucilaginibacter hurinus]
MKVIDTLLEMEKLGFLKELCKGGVISPTFVLYKDLYLFVDSRIKCGQSRTQAVTDAEEQFGIKKTTVYKAMKLMRKTSVR